MSTYRLYEVQNDLTFQLQFQNLETPADGRPLPVGRTYVWGANQQGCDIPVCQSADDWPGGRMVISGATNVEGEDAYGFKVNLFKATSAGRDVIYYSTGDEYPSAPTPVFGQPTSGPSLRLTINSNQSMVLETVADTNYDAANAKIIAVRNVFPFAVNFLNHETPGDSVSNIQPGVTVFTPGSNGANQGCDFPEAFNQSDFDNNHYMEVSSVDPSNGFRVLLYKQHADIYYTFAAASDGFPTTNTPLPGGESQVDGPKKVLVLTPATDENGSAVTSTPKNISLFSLYARQGTTNLASWMGDNQEKVGAKTLGQLVLPGTHDSGTSSFSNNLLDFAPGAPDFLPITAWGTAGGGGLGAALNAWFGSAFLNPVAGALLGLAGGVAAIAQRFSRAQSVGIDQQLRLGARYLDFRVAPRNGDFYLVHGFWGQKVSDALDMVNEFVQQNPKEIVIVDFNHFYEMTADLHRQLAALINTKLGARLISRATGLVPLTTYWNANTNVLVLYGGDQPAGKYYGPSTGADQVLTANTFLFSQAYIKSPWPDKSSVDDLLGYLSSHPKSGPNLAVTQGILTPDVGIIARSLLPGEPDSLLDLGEEVWSQLELWLVQRYTTSPSTLNIVIVDGFDRTMLADVAIAMNTGQIATAPSAARAAHTF